MKKALWIALREFVATVCTKAFVIGLLLVPVLIGVMFFVISRFDDDEFLASGNIAIIDPTGRVTAEARQILGNRPQASGAVDAVLQGAADPERLGRAVAAFALSADFTLTRLPNDADIEEEKTFLFREDAGEARLALVVIHPNAIEPAPGETELGSYDLYVGGSIDDRESSAIRSMLREAIVNLRVESQGFDRREIDRIMRVQPGESLTVTEDVERATLGGLNVVLPLAFMMLLFIGIMGSGQGLMTSTIEEKSSRVVEVLLSAVSPMELMAGKLMGHMSTSLVGMSVYIAAGLFALSSFALLGLLDKTLILYLFLFFLIAFLVFGSLMMAVGAAVNELREAQSLMMPFMFILMLPMFLWMPISRDPSSTLSLVISFVPPVNSFGMMLRLASTEPPPAWQIWTSIGIGVVSVYIVLWCAARVFRIGLLMSGKPPNFRTLLRWIRTG